ncbi:hypothetical protein QFC24_006473 [Naganishia onofrii]|uniref:Uncharacterized protein n=1 Tax=Naganishia onofrii TaxID=1851511 RepID=A0ACC2X1U1_9TREE|nr:hypothetical protein QFC24_006473 [Naganishia onofrii]
MRFTLAGHDERQKVQEQVDAASEEGGELFDARKERKFVRKLDYILVTWAFFAYLLKMDMNNNELNFMDIYFRIGYAVFLLPCQVILTRVRPRWFLPSAELAWGLMTALMAAAKNVQSMYALRFFIGVFEATSYPGIISVLCNCIGNVCLGDASKFDQDAGRIFRTYGMEVAVPDSPGNTKIFWMSESDNRIAKARMDRAERLPSVNYRWGLVKSIFTNPITYGFVLAYSTWSWSQDSNGWFVLFLKAVKNADGTKRFSVAEINAISIPAYALMLLAMLAFAYVHARTGWHTTWIVVQEAWPPAFATKMVGFFLLFCSNAVGPILLGWMSAHFRTPEERGIVIGLAVTFVFPMSAWMSIVFYPAKHAPVYPIGYKAPIGFSIACIALTLVFRWLSARSRRVVPSLESTGELSERTTSEAEKLDGEEWKGDDIGGVPVLESEKEMSRRV